MIRCKTSVLSHLIFYSSWPSPSEMEALHAIWNQANQEISSKFASVPEKANWWQKLLFWFSSSPLFAMFTFPYCVMVPSTTVWQDNAQRGTYARISHRTCKLFPFGGDFSSSWCPYISKIWSALIRKVGTCMYHSQLLRRAKFLGSYSISAVTVPLEFHSHNFLFSVSVSIYKAWFLSIGGRHMEWQFRRELVQCWWHQYEPTLPGEMWNTNK